MSVADRFPFAGLQRIQAFDKATGLTAVRALAPDWHSSAAQMDQQLQAVRTAASLCAMPLLRHGMAHARVLRTSCVKVPLRLARFRVCADDHCRYHSVVVVIS